MYKSTLFVAIVCLFALVEAGSHREDSEVQDGMRRAFNAGMERFGGAVQKRGDTAVPMPSAQTSKVFSLYSRGLKAPGGGKPSVLDQYRKHTFSPLAPSVEPVEHAPITGKMTAGDAAVRYVPHPPLQFASERFGI